MNTIATPAVSPGLMVMTGVAKSNETPLPTAPCVTGTMPSEVHPAGELPGPEPTGPPSAFPWRTKVQNIKPAFAAAVLAVVIDEIVT
ncbi:MAG: hypothetical protein U5J96_19640 [Ignavibacteriaceae bacterium]|nr:hypothetical protein [Ignavibacteriaceae bacterium]